VKPSVFAYSRPESVAEAVSTLASLGPDGKVLAGGQSLIPLLSMRLAAPHHLVDINRLTELSYVSADQAGVRIGALARHAQVERDESAAMVQPLLRQALRLVAHPTIRNRGTTLGSIVHADPSGEMTAVLSLLGGSVTIASAAGERTVDASQFFLGPLESAVQPGELAVSAFFPALAAGEFTAFVEVSRRHGDYAVCGVGVVISRDGDGVITAARAAYLSVSATPLVVDLTEVLSGGRPDNIDATSLQGFVDSRIDPEGDIHATAAYRRHLAGVLTIRALKAAA
jgi:carbon-monoxide dehydrogenase medium subunit